MNVLCFISVKMNFYGNLNYLVPSLNRSHLELGTYVDLPYKTYWFTLRLYDFILPTELPLLNIVTQNQVIKYLVVKMNFLFGSVWSEWLYTQKTIVQKFFQVSLNHLLIKIEKRKWYIIIFIVIECTCFKKKLTGVIKNSHNFPGL